MQSTSDSAEPVVYIGGFEDGTISELVHAQIQAIVGTLGFGSAVEGEIYSTQPLCRGGNVPMVNMAAVNRFCQRFKTKTFTFDGLTLYAAPKRGTAARSIQLTLDKAAL
eukprot:14968566-Alexandrium_andersonii.AAC.1